MRNSTTGKQNQREREREDKKKWRNQGKVTNSQGTEPERKREGVREKDEGEETRKQQVTVRNRILNPKRYTLN